jgi:hypothetical protein
MKAWCCVREKQATSERLVAGATTMAELVQTLPWSTYELGSITTWPVVLRTALTACFASRSPMQVWWGQQFTLFYNEAWMPVLADQHPTALGRHAPERVW